MNLLKLLQNLETIWGGIRLYKIYEIHIEGREEYEQLRTYDDRLRLVMHHVYKKARQKFPKGNLLDGSGDKYIKEMIFDSLPDFNGLSSWEFRKQDL